MKDLNLDAVFKNLFNDNEVLNMEIKRSETPGIRNFTKLNRAHKNKVYNKTTKKTDYVAEPFHVDLAILFFDVLCAKRNTVTLKNIYDTVEIYFNLTKKTCKMPNPTWGTPAFHFQNRDDKGKSLFLTSLRPIHHKKKPSPKRITIQDQILDILSKSDKALSRKELFDIVQTKNIRSINVSLTALKNKGKVDSKRFTYKKGNYIIPYHKYWKVLSTNS